MVQAVGTGAGTWLLLNEKFMYMDGHHLSMNGAMQAHPAIEVALDNVLDRYHEQAVHEVTRSFPNAMSPFPSRSSSTATQ